MSAFDVEPIRPRAVSVVAVIWLYLGVSWLALGLVMLVVGVQLAPSVGSDAIEMSILPTFWMGVPVVAGLGLYGAMGTLRLRSRGRQLLEWSNWLTFALFLLFTLDVSHAFGTATTYFGTPYFDPARAVMPFVIGMVYTLPFAFMAKKLRSPEVCLAVQSAEVRRPEAG